MRRCITSAVLTDESSTEPVAGQPAAHTVERTEVVRSRRDLAAAPPTRTALLALPPALVVRGAPRAAAAQMSASSPPSMAQTVMRGPLTANGSGKPLTKEELDKVREELKEIKAKSDLKEPTRSFMDDKDTKWRYGGPPDYSLTNLLYLKGRTKQHAEGSLEQIVENLVKTWEMERTHKPDPMQHQSVDPATFTIGANGWKKFNNVEANEVGNYNVLMAGCPVNVWDASKITNEQSHEKFHNAFAAFPWELLEVFSGPPSVAFTWRHWGTFTGTYEDNKGKGELVELYGFGVAKVNADLKLVDVDIFYRPETFIQVLKGELPVESLKNGQAVMGPGVAGGCPHLAQLQRPKAWWRFW